MPTISGESQAIQDALQPACCYNQCPPLSEVEDNQFLAILFWYLQETTGIDITTVDPADIKSANDAAWCEVNMDTFCSIPPDKLKAMILYLVTQADI